MLAKLRCEIYTWQPPVVQDAMAHLRKFTGGGLGVGAAVLLRAHLLLIRSDHGLGWVDGQNGCQWDTSLNFAISNI